MLYYIIKICYNNDCYYQKAKLYVYSLQFKIIYHFYQYNIDLI